MSSYLGQNCKRERVPRCQHLILHHALTVFDVNVSAVNDLITSSFTAAIVDDRQCAVAVHRDAFTFTALDRLQLDILDRAVLTSLVFRRLLETRGTTDVERTHGELCARFADGLSGNDAYRLANIDRPARGQVAAIALDAAATSRFAGQHRTNTDALHTGALNLRREILVNLLISIDDDRTINRIDDFFKGGASDDAIAQ